MNPVRKGIVREQAYPFLGLVHRRMAQVIARRAYVGATVEVCGKDALKRALHGDLRVERSEKMQGWTLARPLDPGATVDHIH